MSSTQPGQMVGGRYRLVTDLGSGGFGRVWKAHDETLRIDVAVKELWLPPALSETEQAGRLARAAREARNAARLRDHAHVVAVHDVVVDGHLPWIVMQLVDGCSLAEHLAAQGRLSPEETERVARALLRALGAAHEAGIVHRDIKPANVMLTKSGDVLLTDFGIAVHPSDTALTTSGALIGSVEYMAPERARGTDGLPESDLFSLGVTLYQAVEGLSPFRRGTPTGCLTAVLFEEPPPAGHAGHLAPLITALLDKDPNGRPDIPEALALLGAPKATQRTARIVAPAPLGLPESRSDPEPPVGAQATTAVSYERTRVIGIGLLVVLLVGVAVLTLTRNWPSAGRAADKKLCDRAFQDIAAFQRSYPSYTGQSSDGSAAQTAADRLSADLHVKQNKASDRNVRVALGNYAVVANAKVGAASRSQMYGYLRSACKGVGSTPPA
ncbi:serine/threonine-protein kinase [Streptomyces sp. NPDC006326]|uniref:serine/threonine-protein kinase n=1 Tax=Streptomyces sp. NPDC006326 TaxID=3156752 RepID=UPI0033AA0ECD